MKRRIKLSLVLTLSMLLLLVSLPSTAQVRKPPRRGAIGAGGAGLYGLKSKSRKQVVEREQLGITSGGGSSKSGKRVLSNSRRRVGSRRIIGTTYGGDGQSTLRKRTGRWTITNGVKESFPDLD